LPPDPVPAEVTRDTYIQYDTQVPRGLNIYAMAHFVAALGLAVGLLAVSKSLPRGDLVVAAALVLWALMNIGGIFDHRPWALASELVRLPATAAAAAAVLPDNPLRAPAQVALALAVVALGIWILSYRRHFGTRLGG
jgi:hypothetical protein